MEFAMNSTMNTGYITLNSFYQAGKYICGSRNYPSIKRALRVSSEFGITIGHSESSSVRRV